MANDLSTNPMILDTPGVTLLFPSMVKIRNVEFSEYALDSDTCTIKDAAGKVVVALNGSSDLQTVRTGAVGWVNGIILATLTSGKVRVYIE